MGARIILAAASEARRDVAAQAMLAQHQPGMLAGEDQGRRRTARRKRVRDRRELDRFGTCTDDKGDARAGQLRVSNFMQSGIVCVSRIMAEGKLARGKKAIIAA